MNLRPYQTEAVAQIQRAYAEGSKAPLYTAPTGSGKTVLFAFIAKRTAERGKRVVIVVHRRELLLQGSRALREYGVPHGIVAPGFPRVGMQTRIASVQTLVRRAPSMQTPDLVVLDEGHHAVAGSWARVREAWPGARILGVTATPSRLDGRGLSPPFDRLILGPSVRTLVEQGYLAPLEVYSVPVKARLDDLRTVAGDYDRRQAAVAVDRAVIFGDAIDHYRRLAGGKRAIAFCATLDHASHTVDAFAAAGIPAAQVDGTMGTRDRDAVLAAFTRGSILVLASVNLIEEGFDCPAAECAILLRPTQSVRVYLQQVGRIMRPEPGKACGIVLDHVANTERCGLPDAERVWTLEGRKTRGTRPPPVSRCPSCFGCFTPGPAVCPLCGAALPVREREPLKQVDGELERVRGLAEIQEKVRQRGREEAECVTLEDWQRLGVQRGYRPGWAYVRYNARRMRA